jgi:hypothetical protein
LRKCGFLWLYSFVLLSNPYISKEERLMKVRKIVAGLAAVSMLAAFSAEAVFAADTVSIKAGEAKAAAGENFTLEVSLDGVPADGVNCVEFAVTYDSKAVTITGVSAGKVAQTGVEQAEKFDGVKGFESTYDTAGVVTITYSTGMGDAAYAMGDGVFAVISGTVNKDAADGEYPVKIEAISRETVEGNGVANKEVKAGRINADGSVIKYAATGVAGKITVGTEETKPVLKDASWGDANEDGKVDVLDVVVTNKHILGVSKLSDQGFVNADIDESDSITSADSLNVLKLALKLLKATDCPVK